MCFNLDLDLNQSTTKQSKSPVHQAKTQIWSDQSRYCPHEDMGPKLPVRVIWSNLDGQISWLSTCTCQIRQIEDGFDKMEQCEQVKTDGSI